MLWMIETMLLFPITSMFWFYCIPELPQRAVPGLEVQYCRTLNLALLVSSAGTIPIENSFLLKKNTRIVHEAVKVVVNVAEKSIPPA
jgi:hypothetical protein